MTDERHANRGLPTSDLHGPDHDLAKRKRILRLARNILIAIAIILLLGVIRIVILRVNSFASWNVDATRPAAPSAMKSWNCWRTIPRASRREWCN